MMTRVGVRNSNGQLIGSGWVGVVVVVVASSFARGGFDRFNQRSGGRWITSKARQAYRFIDAHRDEFSIQMMYRLLGADRAGYYVWREHPISDRAQEDARLLRLIRASITASHGIYGTPKGVSRPDEARGGMQQTLGCIA